VQKHTRGSRLARERACCVNSLAVYRTAQLSSTPSRHFLLSVEVLDLQGKQDNT